MIRFRNRMNQCNVCHFCGSESKTKWCVITSNTRLCDAYFLHMSVQKKHRKKQMYKQVVSTDLYQDTTAILYRVTCILFKNKSTAIKVCSSKVKNEKWSNVYHFRNKIIQNGFRAFYWLHSH